MKKMLVVLYCSICFYCLCAAAWGAETYKSLRGDDVPAPSNPPAAMDWQPEETSVPRTFAHQPPLIPHPVEEYDISMGDNDCLDCHGDPDSGAPLPHASHYRDRDHKESDKVTSQWYFCTQCHVGQVDAKPLVENTFEAK